MEDVQVDYGAPVNSLILNQNAVVLTLCLNSAVNPYELSGLIQRKRLSGIQNDSLTAQPGEAALINVNRDLRGAVVEMANSALILSLRSVAAVLNPVAHFLRHLRRALKAKGINEHADISRYTQITDTVTVPVHLWFMVCS